MNKFKIIVTVKQIEKTEIEQLVSEGFFKDSEIKHFKGNAIVDSVISSDKDLFDINADYVNSVMLPLAKKGFESKAKICEI